MDSHMDSVKNSCTDIYYLIIKWVFFFSYLSIYEMSKLILKFILKIPIHVYLSYNEFSTALLILKKKLTI